MTKLTLSSTAPARQRCDALVVGLCAGEGRDATPSAIAGVSENIAETAASLGATGTRGEITTISSPEGVLAGRIVTIGLGAEAELDPNGIREAAANVTRALAGTAKIVSTLGSIDLAAAAEGHLMGAYVFDTYTAPKKEPVGQIALSVGKADKAARSVLERASITAAAVNRARDFVNTAPNELCPEVFAQAAAAAARAAGLSVQVLTEKALERGGFGGIVGVGAGSSRPPRLVRITYRPTKAKTSVALVGKGVTFDSGGLSLKPAAGMDHMTSDMAGAAAVVATVIAAAALELPVAVTATVPMAENLPSGSSYRPGDVLRMRSGKTVHVLNTDAEGRLILADAIARACEDDPDYLLETSTLTGAQVVALGSTMGVMGSPALRDRVAELGRTVGEDAWAMPLPPVLRKGLDSPLADIANVSGNRAGGMLVAGHFLSEFVADGVAWAHLDVAGCAFNTSKPHGSTPQGGTGVPVRTLLATLADIASGTDLHG